MVANKPMLAAQHDAPGGTIGVTLRHAAAAGRNDITVGHGDL
jgi:hypothetical protein